MNTPISSDEPRGTRGAPGDELRRVEGVGQRLDADDLLRQKTQDVPGGVAVVVPEVETVTLVGGATTRAKVEGCGSANEVGAVLLGVEGESKLLLGVDSSDERVFHGCLGGVDSGDARKGPNVQGL